jgi:hypothetical protein
MDKCSTAARCCLGRIYRIHVDWSREQEGQYYFMGFEKFTFIAEGGDFDKCGGPFAHYHPEGK